MTTASPAKRTNRSEQIHAPTTTTSAKIDALSDELTARLQNVGSRVRKSVMEGYIMDRSTSVPTSPYSSPTKPRPASPSGARIFQSANDTLREVFASPPHGGCRAPQSSPNKRERVWSEEPNGNPDSEDGDVEMHTSDSGADGYNSPTFAGSDGSRGETRLVKSLKRSWRRSAQTQSLPAELFQFSDDLQPKDRLPDLGTKKSIDEDWSEDPSFDVAMRPTQDMDQ